ncbi:MAG: WYL domain-containing protein [Candidatus Poribacteria bacterium]|nr:WYL domain-containing protein [Candidatus Poribacteria bacterium]
MSYCTVCKQFADYEYDMMLSNGDHLHTSCLLKLQIREDEIESILRQHSSQLIMSLFVRDEVPNKEVASEEEVESLSSELTKLKNTLTSIYDFLPSWPPDWHERKRHLIQQNGSICLSCGEERDVYLIHEIDLCEGGTNELDNLELICKVCHDSMYGKGDIFDSFTLNPSQSEFAPQVKEIQSAIENNQRIQFDYKKPNAKTWMTRTVVPDRLFNIPNSRDSGQTLCVEGFCELRQDIRVFALERMQGLEVIDY